jgi:hypothetical protein
MGRDSLGAWSGMIFVYDEDSTGAYWMKDTKIPLSIAFVSAQCTIIDIQDMQPLSEELHRAPGPYRYAVEANQGWFAERNITRGDRLGRGATGQCWEEAPVPANGS